MLNLSIYFLNSILIDCFYVVFQPTVEVVIWTIKNFKDILHHWKKFKCEKVQIIKEVMKFEKSGLRKDKNNRFVGQQ